MQNNCWKQWISRNEDKKFMTKTDLLASIEYENDLIISSADTSINHIRNVIEACFWRFQEL